MTVDECISDVEHLVDYWNGIYKIICDAHRCHNRELLMSYWSADKYYQCPASS